jgi:hypothetical protein
MFTVTPQPRQDPSCYTPISPHNNTRSGLAPVQRPGLAPPPSTASTWALMVTLAISLCLAYITARLLDILPSSVPEPWHALLILSLLAPAWFAASSALLDIVPASPRRAYRNWLVLLNASWLIYALLCTLALWTKGTQQVVTVSEEPCEPCTFPFGRSQRIDERHGKIVLQVVLLLISIFLPIGSVSGKPHWSSAGAG